MDDPNSIHRLNLIRIPPGTYKLGVPEAPNDILHQWTGPRHAEIKAFEIADCSVTVGQFLLFLQETEREVPPHFAHLIGQAENLPAGGISWYDAVAYVEWLRLKTGKMYRLPTNDEWETAARGGTDGDKFPWGNEHPVGRCDCAVDGPGTPLPVRSFAPNGYGLYDMAGSIWNWCSDLWVDAVPGDPPVNAPTGLDPAVNRVLRGGSFMSANIGYLMSACMHEDPPDLRHISVGMRLACDIEDDRHG